jgi:hypothetical protein
VRWGSGFCPLYFVTDEGWARLDTALPAAGRSRDELELSTAILAPLPPDGGPAKPADAMGFLQLQRMRGFTTFVVNPAQFVETVEEIPTFAKEVRALVDTNWVRSSC